MSTGPGYDSEPAVVSVGDGISWVGVSVAVGVSVGLWIADGISSGAEVGELAPTVGEPLWLGCG